MQEIDMEEEIFQAQAYVLLVMSKHREVVKGAGDWACTCSFSDHRTFVEHFSEVMAAKIVASKQELLLERNLWERLCNLHSSKSTMVHQVRNLVNGRTKSREAARARSEGSDLCISLDELTKAVRTPEANRIIAATGGVVGMYG